MRHQRPDEYYITGKGDNMPQFLSRGMCSSPYILAGTSSNSISAPVMSGCEVVGCSGLQLVPSGDGVNPLRQRRTTHSPDIQATSATPWIAVQSLPTGEDCVRGNTQPPPTKKNTGACQSLNVIGTCRAPSPHSGTHSSRDHERY